MTMRHDNAAEDWPLRPWIMAAICAIAGLLFNSLADFSYNAALSPLRQAGATFVAVAAVSFVVTVEQRRWTWSLAFALGWGAVVALVGWFSASYNQHPTIFEWPFLSGVFAVLLAAPLFQTVRDEGAWRFPYAKLHGHAWTDAVIGAASLAFVGIAFLLAWLIASLFDLIGIDVVKKLLNKEAFGWMLAGFAFGSAVGLLRERDALVATLQRLVMVVLGVLAPVLAAALALFLLSIPFTGLTKLWDSVVPATPMMLVAGAGAILLANAVIGNGADDRATNRVLRVAALALVLCVLPLAIIAALSLGQRIGQYGWTPERIWGLVAVAVAIGYGLAGWWAVAKGRRDFDDLLRPLQTKMAIGLCGLALLLALPILDFGRISANSQMARLESGKLKAQEFDWTAMAFDFGRKGREQLAQIAKTGPDAQKNFAKAALAATNRYVFAENTDKIAQESELDRNVRMLSPDVVLTSWLRGTLTDWNGCKNSPCALLRLDDRRLLLVTSATNNQALNSEILDIPPNDDNRGEAPPPVANQLGKPADVTIATGHIEVRPVQRRQVFVEGMPIGNAFE